MPLLSKWCIPVQDVPSSENSSDPSSVEQHNGMIAHPCPLASMRGSGPGSPLPGCSALCYTLFPLYAPALPCSAMPEWLTCQRTLFYMKAYPLTLSMPSQKGTSSSRSHHTSHLARARANSQPGSGGIGRASVVRVIKVQGHQEKERGASTTHTF